MLNIIMGTCLAIFLITCTVGFVAGMTDLLIHGLTGRDIADHMRARRFAAEAKRNEAEMWAKHNAANR